MFLCLVACKETTENVKNEGMNKEEVSPYSVFEAQSLDDFYDELFIKILSEEPEYIDDLGDLSEYGVDFQKNLLTDASEMYYLNRETLLKEALVKLDTFEVSENNDAKMNVENVKWYLEMELEAILYRNHTFFLSHIIGQHQGLYNLLIENHTIETKKDVEDLIERLTLSRKKWHQLSERYIDNYNKGYIMDSETVKITMNQLGVMIKSKTKYMDLFKVTEAKIMALDLNGDIKTDLVKALDFALTNSFVPGVEELRESIRSRVDYTKESTGVWSLPNGEAYYKYTLKKHTTTNMSPEEIHILGLSEVARIQEDMKTNFIALGYDGELQVMLNDFINNEPVYRGEDAMAEYVKAAMEMEVLLENMFHKKDLPLTSPDIRVSPGGNYYMTPSIDGKRAGVYYLDLSYGHAEYGIPTLAVHETVPGHHFEREHELMLETIPMVRKLAFYTAYIEGWALYAEMLADEMGFNDTPNKHIGYLKSELHRAARLVVDTGIHYKKWSRTQAVDYLVEEGLLSRGYAQAEVTRYTTWPGQACAYKIGQLKLLAFRDQAEAELAERFDIKDFHEAILGNGSMPMELLETQVKNYIENLK